MIPWIGVSVGRRGRRRGWSFRPPPLRRRRLASHAPKLPSSFGKFRSFRGGFEASRPRCRGSRSATVHLSPCPHPGWRGDSARAGRLRPMRLRSRATEGVSGPRSFQRVAWVPPEGCKGLGKCVGGGSGGGRVVRREQVGGGAGGTGRSDGVCVCATPGAGAGIFNHEVCVSSIVSLSSTSTPPFLGASLLADSRLEQELPRHAVLILYDPIVPFLICWWTHVSRHSDPSLSPYSYSSCSPGIVGSIVRLVTRSRRTV